jgi:histidinol dehydrogenase
VAVRLNASSDDFGAEFSALLAAKRETAVDVNDAVREILDDVRARGDEAVADYTARFDKIEMTSSEFRVTDEDIAAAAALCDPEAIAALDVAAQRIETFHRRHLPTDDNFTDDKGVRLGVRWTPLQAAGLYVPGGKAAYPSSVLMNALPARVAGVERVVMVVPAPGGELDPLVLVAARIAGVHDVYRIGGAQAVGALAFGTDTIDPVDKIVGPGNMFVAAAKRQVFGTVGIDMIAGPSEILVVADGENNPDWIAADLLSQAEHDEAAQSILITDDAGIADQVTVAVAEHLETLPRGDVARASWDSHGAVILVDDLDDAVSLIDRIAPEHLELAVARPDDLMAKVRNAGAIFLGRHTPEAIGDYVAGPNHVLPTARSARFSSGLSVLDFMKRTTIIGCDSDSLAEIGPAAVRLAEAEGLDAHARSIALRLTRSDDGSEG